MSMSGQPIQSRKPTPSGYSYSRDRTTSNFSAPLNYMPTMSSLAGATSTPTIPLAGSDSSAANGPAVDFDSLLNSSSSLLSSMQQWGGTKSYDGLSSKIPGQSATLVERSLMELNVAARHTRKSDDNSLEKLKQEGEDDMQISDNYEAEVSAHRLMAREGLGFDLARLGRSAREFERRAGSVVTDAADAHGGIHGVALREDEKKDGEGLMISSTEKRSEYSSSYELTRLALLQGASLEQILSRHHDYCIQSTLERVRDTSMDSFIRERRARLVSDLNEEQRDMVASGVWGNRFMLGRTGTRSKNTPISMATNTMGGLAARIPMLEGGGSTLESSSIPSAFPTDIVPSPQIMPTGVDAFMSFHFEAIIQYVKAASIPKASTLDALKLVTSLIDGIKSFATNEAIDATSQSALSVDNMKGYLNALLLLKSIMNSRLSLSLFGSSSRAINRNGDFSDAKVAAGVLGACHFFSVQFRDHVVDVVNQARVAGVGGLSISPSIAARLTSVARDIIAFATVELGDDVIKGRGGVWPQLYYCLRCGDLVAAHSILRQLGTTGNDSDDLNAVEAIVLEIVSQLAKMQGEDDTVFGNSIHRNTLSSQKDFQATLLSPTTAIVHARNTVSDLYERIKTRTPSVSKGEPVLAYRLACLAMLGGKESVAEASILEASGLIKTIEDYLYASLWNAVSLAENTSSSDVGLKKTTEAIARLGTLVTQWGPSYFEQEDQTDSSARSAVALVSQGTASLPLKIPQSGGWAYALPLLGCQQFATALTYITKVGGGLGLLQAAHVSVVMDASGIEITDFIMEEYPTMDASQLHLAKLILSFSASLQSSNVVAALQYIVILGKKSKLVRQQIKRLILETRQFEILVGNIQQDGSRSKGVLDEHFSMKDVTSLLAEAAGEALKGGKAADAVELLSLAGRYGAIFSLLNRELASYLVVSNEEEFNRRKFWFNAASRFHEIHLDGGKSYVQNSLMAEDNMSLGNTFGLLMNMVVFFDRYREQQWEGAWDLMNCLELFPKSDSEITIKVNAFSALDSCVKLVFHHIVLVSMEVLCHLYQNLKRRESDHMTIDLNLKNYRTHARLLVTFSRLINLPSTGDNDTYARLAQLEANMI